MRTFLRSTLLGLVLALDRPLHDQEHVLRRDLCRPHRRPQPQPKAVLLASRGHDRGHAYLGLGEDEGAQARLREAEGLRLHFRRRAHAVQLKAARPGAQTGLEGGQAQQVGQVRGREHPSRRPPGAVGRTRQAPGRGPKPRATGSAERRVSARALADCGGLGLGQEVGGQGRAAVEAGGPGHRDRPMAGRAGHTLKRKLITSPSFTSYSLPSRRRVPLSRQAAMEPAATRSS